MKNHQILMSLLTVLLPAVISPAQTTFTKTIGGSNVDDGRSIQQTNDGGYILLGTTHSFGSGSHDFYLIKTDSYGDTLWTRTYGQNTMESGVSVYQTNDGGYIITGNTSDGITFADIGLVKTDPNGVSVWSKKIGGSGVDEGNCVIQTADGGYVVAGSTVSYGAGDDDAYLIKTDANGDTLWTKVYGGPGDDRYFAVWQTSDSGYIAAGRTSSFGFGTFDIYLVKTDAAGNITWSKTYGGSNIEVAYSVRETFGGGYAVSGYTQSFGAGSADVCLLKTDAGGNLLWNKTYGSIENDGAYAMSQTTDGGYVMGGYSWSFGIAGTNDFYLVKTDSSGDLVWSKIFGDDYLEWGSSVQQTSDAGFIMAGFTARIDSVGEVYFVKTDANGNSGCYQGNPSTIVNSQVMNVTSPTVQVTSGGIVTPWIASANGGGILTALCSSTGMSELNAGNEISVYPNPSDDIITISFAKPISNGVIIITDISGRSIWEESILNESKKLMDLTDLPGGVYLVNVADNESNFCDKIVLK